MATTTGLGQILTGSGADRVTRQNLTDLSGTLWEAVTDWWFGYSSVDMDWSSAGDSAKFRRWIYTAADSIDAQVTIDTVNHQASIDAVTGTAEGLSNERDLFVIDETATWGVAHAQCEIVAGYSWFTGNNPSDYPVIKPQHGIGLRAQEDTARRTVIAWHDTAIGLPQAINLGVWRGELDGSNFSNRQANVGMDLQEDYVCTAASRTEDPAAGFTFTGSATANWTTPDTAALDVVGDLTLEVDFTPTTFPPAAAQCLIAKYNTAGQRSYRLRLETNGRPTLFTSTDGVTALPAATATATPSLTSGRVAIRCEIDVDVGGTNRTVRFYTAPTSAGTFTQLGADVTTAGTTTIFNGSAPLELAAITSGTAENFAGRIHRAIVKNGVAGAGTNVADARAKDHPDGAVTFFDDTGLTWTRIGTASCANLGTGTATIGTHALRVGDKVGMTLGDEQNITALQRTGGSACQCTLPGGHGFTTGDYVRLLFCSDTSFNTSVFITVSGNTATWTHAGANNSAQTGIMWQGTYKLQTAHITSLTPTTITYPAPGATKATIPVTANSKAIREFPYFMEMKLEGTVAAVRCWGRHQAVPSWMSSTNALISDLSQPSQVYTVTAAARVSNVVTATIGPHNLVIGERITLSAMTDSTFNQTNAIVLNPTATTFDYDDTGSDNSGVTGTATRMGSGSAATVISSPCPTGSGRVAFVGAHIGVNDWSRCVYGPFFGDNDPDSSVLALTPDGGANVLRGTFTFPQVTAGVAGTPATVTPAVIARSFTLPASGENVGAGPAVTALSLVEPQPAVNVAAGPAVTALSFLFPASTESVAAGPAVLPLAWSLPQATPQAGSTVTPAVMARSFALGQATENVGAGPAVVPLSFVLPAPAESVGAGPAVIARALTLPQAVESVGAAPAVIPLAFALPQATPVTAGNATALPAVLAAIAAFPQALAQGGATVAPAVLAAISAFGQATESVAAGPLVIARAFALPQATPLTAGNATATPLVIDRLFAFGATVENVSAGPVVLARSFVLPQATPSLPALAAPAVVARSFVLPATAVTVAAAATPAAIAVLAALARPGVNVGVTPASLARAFLFGLPTSGSFPPDPNPIFISFTEGRNGRVSFDSRVGMLIFEEPQ